MLTLGIQTDAKQLPPGIETTSPTESCISDGFVAVSAFLAVELTDVLEMLDTESLLSAPLLAPKAAAVARGLADNAVAAVPDPPNGFPIGFTSLEDGFCSPLADLSAICNRLLFST